MEIIASEFSVLICSLKQVLTILTPYIDRNSLTALYAEKPVRQLLSILTYFVPVLELRAMNFYFEAAKTLDRLDAKQGSVKAVIGSLPEKVRKRTAALVIETLKCEPILPATSLINTQITADKSVLTDVINASNILRDERKKITSLNLALVLVHDVLLCNGIQAGDGPVKQAVLRHKARLHSELQRIKVKLGVKSNVELAQSADHRAGLSSNPPPNTVPEVTFSVQIVYLVTCV